MIKSSASFAPLRAIAFGSLEAPSILVSSPNFEKPRSRLWRNIAIQLLIAVKGLAQVTAASAPGTLAPDDNPRYFPAGIFAKGQSDGTFLAHWYTEQLKALQEPSLWTGVAVGAEPVYRFTWLRTHHHPIAVRLTVHAGGTGTLTGKMTDGRGGDDPGKLVANFTREVGVKQVQHVLDLVKYLAFSALALCLAVKRWLWFRTLPRFASPRFCGNCFLATVGVSTELGLIGLVVASRSFLQIPYRRDNAFDWCCVGLGIVLTPMVIGVPMFAFGLLWLMAPVVSVLFKKVVHPVLPPPASPKPLLR